jgi:hypothetical protein
MGLALTGAMVLTSGAAQAAKVGVTDFGLQGAAFGTRVIGGTLPGESGRTAFAVVSCTRKVGLTRANSLTGVNLGGVVKVGAISTVTKTSRDRKGLVHVLSRSSVASVSVTPEGAPAGLTISGLVNTAHAWGNGKGFNASAATSGVMVVSVGGSDISIPELPNLPLPAGEDVKVPLPGAGETITIPGLATITNSFKTEKFGKRFAFGRSNGLRIALEESGSRVIVGSAWARVNSGLPAGVMAGNAFASESRLLGGAVTSGRWAVKELPCQGTGGRWHTTAPADVKIPPVSPQVQVTAAKSSAYGIQYDNGGAKARTRSSVPVVSLGGGQAVIRGIYAQARVTKTSQGKYFKDALNTTPGSVTFNGERHALPSHGSYDLGPLGTIQTGVVRKGRFGIRVTAVKVTLLNGSAADTVFYIGNARAYIKPL